MQFTKYHCLANDFVLFNYEQLPRQNLPASVNRIANRRRGVGCDQLLIYRNPASPMVEIYNSDGAQVGMCGNGLCALGHLLMQQNNQTAMTIRTKTGEHVVRQLDLGYVQVDITVPKFDWYDIPLAHASAVESISESQDSTYVKAGCVNVGNPHLVFFVDDLSKIDTSRWGAKFENDELFPEGVNVGFAQIKDDGIHLRVWERGVGYTYACGSGACAAFVVARHLGILSQPEVHVLQEGGAAKVSWKDKEEAVSLTAAPTAVFQGEIF